MLQCLWGDQDNLSEDFQLASLPGYLLDNWHLPVFDLVQYHPIRNMNEMHGFFKQVLALDFWVGNSVGLQVKITDFGARKGPLCCLPFPAAYWGSSNVNPVFPSDCTPWLPSPLSCSAQAVWQEQSLPQHCPAPCTGPASSHSSHSSGHHSHFLAHSQKKLKCRSCSSRREHLAMLSAAHCFAVLDAQLGSLGTNKVDGCFQPESLPLP